MTNYFGIRQKVALSLKRAGLRVKYPFKVPLGWVDVAIFKRGSIGIDICIEKPQSSFKRLKSYPFKRRVVLNLTNEAFNKKGYYVVNSLKELEEFIKNEVKVNVNLDTTFEKKHIEFSRYFLKFGNEMELRAIKDALVFLYISKGVLEEKLDNYYFKALKTITPRLKEFNLVLSSSKGVKPKYHTMFLNSSGMTIAREILIDRIIEKESFLRSLVKKFGSKKMYIIFTAIQRDSHLVYDDSKQNRESDYQSLLLKLKNLDLHSLIKRLVYYNYSQTPLSIFCYIITYVALYSTAVDVLKILERSGLASKVPIYSPYGIKVEERFNVPQEVIDFILKISDAEIDEDTINETVLLSLLLKTRLDEIEILQNIGIPHGKIEEIKSMLNEKGLIENGKLKSSYENFLKIKIAKACDKILNN